jgi:outer membrane protein assembly factor BamB
VSPGYSHARRLRPELSLKRASLILAVVLVVGIAGAAAAYKLKTRGSAPTKVVRGSSTREFVPTEAPTPPKRSPRALQTIAWPTYGYTPTRTHVAPAEYDLHPPYHVLWTKRAHYYIEFPPAVAYGRVFLQQLHGRFFALDARTGKVLWRRRWKNVCSAASPTVSRGIVYEVYLPPPCNYGDRNGAGFVVAWNARTGKRLWRLYLRGGSESSPLVVGKTLYFGAWDHRLWAIDVSRPQRPRIRWRFDAGEELNSGPVYWRGTIYIGGMDGHVFAVGARTGRLRWRATGSSEGFYATPAVAYGRVYAANVNGGVYAFGARTGHLLWSQRAGTYAYAAPVIWNRTVYQGSYDGNMYALDAATGDVRWRRPAPSSIHGAPTILDGLLYFSTCGRCGHRGSRYAKQGPRVTLALDARNGRVVWSFPDGKYSPLVADETRAYLAGETRLYALVPCSRWLARAPKGEKRRIHGPPHRRRC